MLWHRQGSSGRWGGGEISLFQQLDRRCSRSTTSEELRRRCGSGISRPGTYLRARGALPGSGPRSPHILVTWHPRNGRARWGCPRLGWVANQVRPRKDIRTNEVYFAIRTTLSAGPSLRIHPEAEPGILSGYSSEARPRRSAGVAHPQGRLQTTRVRLLCRPHAGAWSWLSETVRARPPRRSGMRTLAVHTPPISRRPSALQGRRSRRRRPVIAGRIVASFRNPVAPTRDKPRRAELLPLRSVRHVEAEAIRDGSFAFFACGDTHPQRAASASAAKRCAGARRCPSRRKRWLWFRKRSDDSRPSATKRPISRMRENRLNRCSSEGCARGRPPMYSGLRRRCRADLRALN